MFLLSSSDFANSTSQKEKRKERLKQYLKQLKQIVAPEAIVGTQMSTIGALKHVINSFQKSKDGKKYKAFSLRDLFLPERPNFGKMQGGKRFTEY